VLFTFEQVVDNGNPGDTQPITIGVNINAGALANGAAWSLDGGANWYTTERVSHLADYSIIFNPAWAWRTPPPRTGTLSQETTLTAPYPHAVNDYAGNGVSDILFRNGAFGWLYEWDMWQNYVNDGAFFNKTPGLPVQATTAVYSASDYPGKIVAQADFNDDGLTDLLFEHPATKALTVWMMNAITVVSQATLTITPPRTATEVVAGVGDFNGDGKADILLIDPGAVASTGNLTARILFSNGSGTPTSTPVNASIPQSATANYGTHTGWHVAAIADFDNDGKADILWRFANQVANVSPAWSPGQTSLWYMNGATRVNVSSLPIALGPYQNTVGGANPTGLQIAGMGDFNGDGYMDILLRNGNTGSTAIWLMRGVDPSTLMPIKMANDADINGIGDARGSGYTVDGNGLIISAGAYTGSTTTGKWSVVGIGDFDGDGKDDVLWRYLNTGHTYVWTMDGRTIIGGGFTSVYPGLPAAWSSEIMRNVLEPQ
jgi:hypothetical protein